MKQRKPKSSLAHIKKWPYIFLAPFFVSYAVFSVYPIIQSFLISLTNWNGISEKKFIGLKNYINLFTTDAYFWKSIGTTTLTMLIVVPVSIFLSLVFSAVLDSMSEKASTFFRVTNFLPYITTSIAVGLLFALLFGQRAGVVNGALMQLGIIEEPIYWLGYAGTSRFVLVVLLLWQGLGYSVVLYCAALAGVDRQLYEAAEIDGANAVQRFFRITIPLLRPITLFSLITKLSGALQLYEAPMMLFSATGGDTAGGPGRVGLTTMWYFYDTAFRTQMNLGKGAAISYALLVFILLFTGVGQKLMDLAEQPPKLQRARRAKKQRGGKAG